MKRFLASLLRRFGGARPAEAPPPVRLSAERVPLAAWLRDHGVGEWADAVASIAWPCVGVQSEPRAEAKIAIGASKLGGRPDLPAGFAWPTKEGKRLTFLAQIDLAAASIHDSPGVLPRSGYLWFFYDNEDQPWGFDPKDRGGWAVRFSEEAATNLTRAEEDDGGHEDAGFTPCALHFARKWSVPQDPNSRCGTGLSATENGALSELAEAVTPDSPVVTTGHHLLGYPWPVQGDGMEEECQLASGGVYCGGSGPVDQALVDRLRPDADRWRLLLQLDSDDNADMMWGDCGMLYFWIPRESLIARRFEDVWVVLQCS